MKARTWTIIAAVLTIAAGIIIAATVAFTPQQTHPAYAAAVAFTKAAASGDDAAAFALLTPEMQTYIEAACPGGRVSACVDGYIPDAWGGFLNVVFRRAAPDPTRLIAGGASAYDVDLIATYAQDKGFSGVCIYNRMEQNAEGVWQVAGYAGFVACGDAVSRHMAANPDAPNRAP